MTSDALKTLVAEYRYEKNTLVAGNLYNDICRHIELLVLDKCRAQDKLRSMEKRNAQEEA